MAHQTSHLYFFSFHYSMECNFFSHFNIGGKLSIQQLTMDGRRTDMPKLLLKIGKLNFLKRKKFLNIDKKI